MNRITKLTILGGVSLLVLGASWLIWPQAPDLGGHKVPKEKIVSFRVIHTPAEQMLLGGGTSTPKVLAPAKDEVEYLYVSNKVTTAKPYWGNNPIISNAEHLPTRPDGLQPIAFYAEPQFYKDGGTVYDIKSARIPKSEFDAMTKETVISKIRSIFIDTAVATTTFTASSTYTPDATGTITILVIGGGGAGGGYDGGGGGAGGYIASTTFPVTNGTPYTVTVGAAGERGAATNDPGFRGGTSTFETLIAVGGGGGGSFQTTPTGQAGGSGGGGAILTGSGGTGTAGQGNDGGGQDAVGGVGGGGGASGAGGNGVGTVSGAGGLGTTSTITGTAVGYAGGGGGGRDGGVTGGAAGQGGGAGGIQTIGTAAVTSTGGGGGGGGGNLGGGKGGTGVIIIAFNSSTPAAAPARGSVILFE